MFYIILLFSPSTLTVTQDETPSTPQPPPQSIPATSTTQTLQQTPPSSRPVTTAHSPCTPARQNTSLCAWCGYEAVQVKRHVRNTEACLKFYRDEYGIQDLDRIFKIIENERKQLKRRNDRQNGTPRADNLRRGNYSIRTQKKHFVENITSLFEKRCVFCQRYFLKVFVY